MRLLRTALVLTVGSLALVACGDGMGTQADGPDGPGGDTSASEPVEVGSDGGAGATVATTPDGLPAVIALEEPARRALITLDAPTAVTDVGRRLAAATGIDDAIELLAPGGALSLLRSPAFDVQRQVLVSVAVESTGCGVRFAGFRASAGRRLTPTFTAPGSTGAAGCEGEALWASHVVALDRAAVAPWFVLTDPEVAAGAGPSGSDGDGPAGDGGLRVDVAKIGPAAEEAARRVMAIALDSPAGTEVVSATDGGATQLGGPPSGPPPVTVYGAGGEFEVRPHTTCWHDALSAYCADGVPPPVLPAAGAFDGPVRFTFPLDGWTFTASTGPPYGSPGAPGQAPSLRVPAPVVPLAPHVWEVDPAGHAGPVAVHLSGWGPQGDAHVAFGLDQLVDGVQPQPLARLIGVYPDNDPAAAGRLVVMWLEVSAIYVADDRDPSGTVTVIAADGTATPVMLGPHPDGDVAGDGFVTLRSTEVDAQAAVAAGPAPHRFEVALVLGGVTHTASASMPEDLVPSIGGAPLEFDPPLPARS